jgi:L-fucose isomerase-like protein
MRQKESEVPDSLTIGLIRASLPSYFPARYQVWERAEAALGSLCEEAGARLVTLPDIPMNAADTARAIERCHIEGVDFILLLHGGFTMGDVARTIAASPFRAGFWSVPEPVRTGDVQLNNFVSLNMSLSIARQVRDLSANPVQWYHGAPDSPVLQARLRKTLRALAAAKSLQGAKIGLVGGLAMTFYNMEVSSNLLRTRLGIEVASHDIHELTGRMAAIPADRVAAEQAAMAAKAPVEKVSAAQMGLTARCALALRDMADAGGYAALAVSDWPALQADPGMHPGAAFSWLEEIDGLPVASEGDVLGAVSQLVALALTKRVGYLLDMTEPDLDAGQLLVWHGGGGPLYLADKAGARWINHPMIGRGTPEGPRYGAICDLVFQDGPVTLFRVARDAGALFTMTGTIRGREPSGFAGCRGWLEGFRIGEDAASLEDVVSTVMAHGLEHHFILVPGDVASELAEFGAWTGMAPLGYRPMRDHLDATDFT